MCFLDCVLYVLYKEVRYYFIIKIFFVMFMSFLGEYSENMFVWDIEIVDYDYYRYLIFFDRRRNSC